MVMYVPGAITQPRQSVPTWSQNRVLGSGILEIVTGSILESVAQVPVLALG